MSTDRESLTPSPSSAPAESKNLYWRSVIRDAIYGLRHQPELSREQIAQALANALADGAK